MPWSGAGRILIPRSLAQASRVARQSHPLAVQKPTASQRTAPEPLPRSRQAKPQSLLNPSPHRKYIPARTSGNPNIFLQAVLVAPSKIHSVVSNLPSSTIMFGQSFTAHRHVLFGVGPSAIDAIYK